MEKAIVTTNENRVVVRGLENGHYHEVWREYANERTARAIRRRLLRDPQALARFLA